MAWIILPTAGELTSTGYGLALLLKVALVLVVIALGAYNRYRLVPAVEDRERVRPSCRHERPGAARRWLGNVVIAELVLLVAAVGVTAVMVTRSPLSSATSAAAAPTAPATETVTVQLGDAATAEVTVSPGSVGANIVDLELRDLEGRVVNPYEAPVVELSVPALDVGPLRPEVVPLGIGRYEATADMGFAGTWDLTDPGATRRVRVRCREHHGHHRVAAGRHGDQPDQHDAHELGHVGGLVDERDAPLGEVDRRGDHQRSGEDRGDGQHRAGPSRSGDDDEETDAVGDGEGAEVPGRVGGRRPLVAEQCRDGDDDDLHGDDCEEGAHASSASRRGRRRRRRGSRAVRDRRAEVESRGEGPPTQMPWRRSPGTPGNA